MKRFKIYSLLLAATFFLFGSADVLAQNRNNGNRNNNSEKARKEYYKQQEKERKAYNKYIEKQNKNNDRNYSYVGKRNGPPAWAPAHGYRAKNHVYFRDYQTFYDPYREGYVYRRNDKWVFSRSVPTFLVGVNLGSARMNIITDIPVNRRPEQYYSRYANRYPRDSRIQVNISLF